MRNDTLNRAYGHCPRNVPNVLSPLEDRRRLHVFMRRVDWMLYAAIAGFLACMVVW